MKRTKEQTKILTWEAKYNENYSWYEERFKEQNGKCLICKENDISATDHCHKCRLNRGLLCRECNAGLGLLKDSAENLRRAADYVEDHYKNSYRHVNERKEINPAELIKRDLMSEIGTILSEKGNTPI